jgi:predicted acyl esterase
MLAKKDCSKIIALGIVSSAVSAVVNRSVSRQLLIAQRFGSIVLDIRGSYASEGQVQAEIGYNWLYAQGP